MKDTYHNTGLTEDSEGEKENKRANSLSVLMKDIQTYGSLGPGQLASSCKGKKRDNTR